MIEFAAEKLAWAIKRANRDETASVEVLRYALIVLMNTLGTLILSLSIGIMTEAFGATCLSLASFALLRSVSGGYHLKSADLCVAVSSAMMSSFPHIPLSDKWTYTLTFASLMIVWLLAPQDIEDKSRIPAKYSPLLKWLSCMLVSANLLLASSVVALSFFAQAVSLIMSWGEGRRG